MSQLVLFPCRCGCCTFVNSCNSPCKTKHAKQCQDVCALRTLTQRRNTHCTWRMVYPVANDTLLFLFLFFPPQFADVFHWCHKACWLVQMIYQSLMINHTLIYLPFVPILENTVGIIGGSSGASSQSETILLYPTDSSSCQLQWNERGHVSSVTGDD